MITLITGQPGAGKTLYALNYVKSRAEKENREVYFSGIADLKLPWKELDRGEDWHKVPKGSIVVIDECQRVFRPRGNGAAVPEHVAKLETHRHEGIDLVLITQHPMLADTNVRRLVGQHFHVVRAFGTKKATVHEWGEVKTECEKSRADSIRHDFLYPAQSFTWYKSAEVHTHKARIPMRVYFLFLLPVLLGLLVWAAWSSWHLPGSGSSAATASKAPAASPVPQVQNRTKSPQQYIDDRAPRVAGLAYTAPAYDEVTRPDEAPFPAACVESKTGCRCYSQQATQLDVPHGLCSQIVARGYFKDWGNGSRRSNEKNRNADTMHLQAARLERDSAPGIDRTSIQVIPAPPPLRVSPGFNSSDTPKDQPGAQNVPRVPTGSPWVAPKAPGVG